MNSDSESPDLPPVLFKLPNLAPTAAAKPARSAVTHDPTAATAIPETAVARPEIAIESNSQPAQAQHKYAANEAAFAAPELIAREPISSARVEDTDVHPSILRIPGLDEPTPTRHEDTSRSQERSSQGPALRTDPTSQDEENTSSPSQRSLESRPARDIRDTRPAGRTWMEAAVAHRTVLVLLGVVIGAAFWTSRRPSTRSDVDSSIAKVDQALELDSDNLITDFSIGDKVDDLKENASTKISELNQSLESTIEKISDQIDDQSIAVSLNAPTPTVSPATSASEPASPGAEAAEQFASNLDSPAVPSLGVDAMMVSSQSSRSTSIDLPTLEVLASDPTVVDGVSDLSAPANVNNFFSGPKPSATPAAVSDWLQYLPPVQTQPGM
ncbi:hypothetical protein [Rubripirellula reticaptiva]|nr:hypothetical protein [Rubripirellula reticaptiva]